MDPAASAGRLAARLPRGQTLPLPIWEHRHQWMVRVIWAQCAVLFVFEGPEVEWRLDQLVDAPFQWAVSSALDEWREIVVDNVRIARPAFEWSGEVEARG